MPPSRPRPNLPDDSRSEASSITNAKERALGPTSNAGVLKGKSRAVGPYTTQNGLASSSRATATILQLGNSNAAETGDREAPKIPWSSLPHSLLHTYRHTHSLSSIPPSYTHPHASAYLSQGIGLQSPSSVAMRKRGVLDRSRKSSRISSLNNDKSVAGRVGKEALAMAVRKHFNSMSVNEGDVVARFAYVVRQHDGREFRLRFRP